MLNTRKLSFLRNRITRLESAILHIPDGMFFNVQSVAARILELDEHGNLWLVVDDPAMNAENEFACFSILLNYYRKGVAFDFDLLGEACICTEEATIKRLTGNAQNEYSNGNILLKVCPVDIDYSEHKIHVFKKIGGKLLRKFSGSMAENGKVIKLPSGQRFA